MVKLFSWMIGGVLAGSIIALWAKMPALGGAVAVSAVIVAAVRAARWIAPAK